MCSKRKMACDNVTKIFNTRTHAHTHTFNGPLSGATRVSRYQKGKTNLDFTEARDSEWQWHQLGHMQVCTSLQRDNHASTPPLCFLQAGCLSCHPTNSVKALNVLFQHTFRIYKIIFFLQKCIICCNAYTIDAVIILPLVACICDCYLCEHRTQPDTYSRCCVYGCYKWQLQHMPCHDILLKNGN